MQQTLSSDDKYISPNNIAKRWDMSTTSVHRVAKRAGFTPFLVGEGKNGSVRYLRKEVFAYEDRRST